MIKTIIEFGIKKPILNHLLLLFLFMLAIASYYKISKEIFPPSTLDAISITGVYAGASSDILDKMAVETIESDLGSVSEIDKISTIVKNGSFTIKLELKDGNKPLEVINDVKDIVEKVKDDLPSDMNEPVTKVVKHTFPLITIAVYGSDDKEKLLDISDEIKTRLLKLEDLSEITIFGDSDKELLITFNEEKIEALNLSRTQVVSAISDLSSIIPVGIIKDTTTHYYLSTQNGEKDINNIKNTILKIDDKRIYIKDIADVRYKFADVQNISHFNGLKNISIGVNKGRSGDAIELVKEIKTILQEFEKKYPELQFDTYTDTSIWIKNRLNTVVSNILFGLILLFIALFYFINVRIAIVIAIGIPTSFMIALIFAQMLDYSLNMLSLLGALIALGMLVDEAIVVAENIYRHMEMGKDRLSAAIDGAMEMYPAVLTATATTIFAFLPILLMSGDTGRFMQILPIMISILLLSSLFEAFFFLPLHAKELFKVNTVEKKADNIWQVNKRIYNKILGTFLKGKYISLFILIAFVGILSFTIIKVSKFQFLPDFDSTQVYVSGSVGVGKKIEQTEEIVHTIEELLMKKVDFSKDISSISSVVGMKLDGKNLPEHEEFYFQMFVNLHERAPQNLFDIFINPYLSPKYDDTDMIREKSSNEIRDELQKYLEPLIKEKTFEDLKVFVPKAGIVKNDIEIAIDGKNEDVNNAVKVIKNELSKILGVKNIADDSKEGNFELKFRVNEYGQLLGINENQIINELRPFYFKGEYSKMFDEKGLVDIVFQSKDKDILVSLDDYEIKVPGSEQYVYLKNVVNIDKIPAYTQIIKENNKRIRSVTASLSNKITSHEVYEKLDNTLNLLRKNVNIEIKGEEEENKKVQKEMGEAFAIALLLIFISLVWMFNSTIKSLIILSTIPLSVLGVLIGHLLLGMNITMPSLIGIVGLAGVIVNDGIIMMDFIKEAKNIKELKEKAMLRLRPILLTSITTVLGLFTLMFFASGQALILQPMAVALGFGIVWATILNLYYIPLMFRLIYLRKD